MNPTTRSARTRGFTLVEVLISMVVIAIGLLGIAKMQALAFSSTGVASMRSLAAIEASSLAASMHADRAYWASGVAATAPGVTITGTVISDPNLAQVANCTVPLAGVNPPDCAPIVLAAYDVQTWAGIVGGPTGLLPNPVTNVSCNNIVGQPVVCTITIVWSENMVAINTQGQAAMQLPTYVLYVEP